MDLKYFTQPYQRSGTEGAILEAFSEVITDTEASISQMNEMISMDFMPEEIMFKWLQMNEIPISYDTSKDRNAFKRYYKMLKSRGSLRALDAVLKSNGGIYNPSDSLIQLTDSVTTTLHFGDSLDLDKHVFDGDKYSFGVIILETDNPSIVDNRLLKRFMPAGVRFYILGLFYMAWVMCNETRLQTVARIKERDSDIPYDDVTVTSALEVPKLTVFDVNISSYNGKFLLEKWNGLALEQRDYNFLDVGYVELADRARTL